MDNELLTRLQALEEKVDRILSALADLRAGAAARPAARKKKEKLPPPTQEEISAYRGRFSELFDRWMAGRESEVQDELENLDLEQLRRFADANNLNVTAKMSKAKILQLIGARFREKRQLHKPPVIRGDRGE